MAETNDDHLPICSTCGTQFDIPSPGSEPPKRCKICDDPRQFVRAYGQVWTTLPEARKKHKNTFRQDPHEPNIWYIGTTPQLGIGQRACFIKSPDGNILWDCIAFIDDETKEFIDGHGGLKAIVISHPHYYTTSSVWAKVFNTTVYTASEDQMWWCRNIEKLPHSLIKSFTQDITPSMKAIKLGGHFDGSLVLLWKDHLFIADTLMTIPGAHTPHPRPPGQHTFAFMWSIPNMIPLSADEVSLLWKKIKDFDFRATHGGFDGQDVYEDTFEAMKKRVYDSMCTQVTHMGGDAQALIKVS